MMGELRYGKSKPQVKSYDPEVVKKIVTVTTTCLSLRSTA
jgi:hypothetical protein